MTLTVEQAQQAFVASAIATTAIERVAVENALGRIVAIDVNAAIQVPPADNSAMDGFAVNTDDFDREGVVLPVTQRITAGSLCEPLRSGSAARIFTGGTIPPGANAVVIQENCDIAPNADRVTILKPVSPGQNIRPAGQDIRQGDLVVSKGQALSPVDLGLLASVGESQVDVFCPLKIAIFSTGDELAAPGQTLAPGQIYNSNRVMLLALCQQLGYKAIDCGIVDDTLTATKDALLAAAAQADLVISSGGVSVGEEDHIRPAIEEIGSLQHWKVQMKPGKPVVLGQIGSEDGAQGARFLGLPGNPVSSYLVFQLLAIPLMQAMQGANVKYPIAYPVTASFDKAAGSREEYLRVRLTSKGVGLQAELFDNQSSGVLYSLAWSHGLVRQAIDQEINCGDRVEFLPLRGGCL